MADEGPSPPKIPKLDTEAAGGSNEAEERSEVEQSIDDMHRCQSELDVYNEQAKIEIVRIKECQKIIKAPSYERRFEIIERIPDFWHRSKQFLNHMTLSSLLDERSGSCMKYLRNLDVEEFVEEVDNTIYEGYRIKFYFSENPFFENDVLVKEFHLRGPEHATSTSTPVIWKEGEEDDDPLDTLSETRSQVGSETRSEATTETRSETTLGTVSRTASEMTSNLSAGTMSSRTKECTKSFMTWLKDHENPRNDECAQLIKNDLFPNPLCYYDDVDRVGTAREARAQFEVSSDETTDMNEPATADEATEEPDEQADEGTDQEGDAAQP